MLPLPHGSRDVGPRDVGPLDGPPVCSAKECRQQARWLLVWRNPRLHTADREKTWVACDDHREHLSGFLDLRGFLLRVEPLPDEPPAQPPGH